MCPFLGGRAPQKLLLQSQYACPFHKDIKVLSPKSPTTVCLCTHLVVTNSLPLLDKILVTVSEYNQGGPFPDGIFEFVTHLNIF